MGKSPALALTQIEELRRLDSATVANAVESFGVRLPNAGFTDSTIHCLFPDFPPMVGYAVTARIRTANPPMEGHAYVERTEWLNHILSIPEPRVVLGRHGWRSDCKCSRDIYASRTPKPTSSI